MKSIEWKHACAILKQDFPNEWSDICDVLTNFRLKKSWLTVGGGRKSKVADALDSALGQRGWQEKAFDAKFGRQIGRASCRERV